VGVIVPALREVPAFNCALLRSGSADIWGISRSFLHKPPPGITENPANRDVLAWNVKCPLETAASAIAQAKEALS
jgi:hypothetical protein